MCASKWKLFTSTEAGVINTRHWPDEAARGARRGAGSAALRAAAGLRCELRPAGRTEEQSTGHQPPTGPTGSQRGALGDEIDHHEGRNELSRRGGGRGALEAETGEG